MNSFLLFVLGICNPQFRNAVKQIHHNTNIHVRYDSDSDTEYDSE